MASICLEEKHCTYPLFAHSLYARDGGALPWQLDGELGQLSRVAGP
jgi:hypothetical protein